VACREHCCAISRYYPRAEQIQTAGRSGSSCRGSSHGEELKITSNERRRTISHSRVPSQRRGNWAFSGLCAFQERSVPSLPSHHNQVEARHPWESLAFTFSPPPQQSRALVDCARPLQIRHSPACVPASIPCAGSGIHSSLHCACLFGSLVLARFGAPRSLPLRATHKTPNSGTDARVRQEP
jgi:hypothetical protein